MAAVQLPECGFAPMRKSVATDRYEKGRKPVTAADLKWCFAGLAETGEFPARH